MNFNRQEVEAAISAERAETPDERCQVLDHRAAITADAASGVLKSLRLPTSRSKRELESDIAQICKDAQVAFEMTNLGGVPARSREVRHWAYFATGKPAAKFANFVANAGYTAVLLERSSAGKQRRVRFTHVGDLQLGNICGHTVRLSRLACDVKGSYDGFEVTFNVDEADEASQGCTAAS